MNKTIVIIGGSTGIGKSLVEKAAQDSSNKIIAFARRDELMKKNFSVLDNVITAHIDLEFFNEEKFSKSIANIGPIDVLINNAGYLVKNNFENLSILRIYCSFLGSLFFFLFDEILRGMFEAENEVGYYTSFREI